MTDYVLLIKFTTQGIQKIKESPARLENWKKMLADAGAKLKMNYIVLGKYDIVQIIEAPDDETMAMLSLQIGSLGAVQIQTLRAFSENEYLNILHKMK